MSGSRFENSWSRLRRAVLHRAAFEKEYISLFEGVRSTAVRSEDNHPGWWTLSLHHEPQTIRRLKNNQLSLLLGEFAYQLRAALDGLIWETVTLTQGAEPAADAKGLNCLEFPLAPKWKAKDFEKDRFHGFPFPQGLIDWMRNIQPGMAEKPIGHPERGLQNTLEDIHNLARHDRHRRLRVVSMLPLDQKIKLISTEPPGGKVVGHRWLECDPLNDQYDVISIQVVCPGGLSPYKVTLEPHLTFTVFSEDVEAYEGANIGVQLDRFIQSVETVINRFEQ